MKKKITISIAIIILGVLIGGAIYFSRQEPQQEPEPVSQNTVKSEEQEVRELVLRFGEKLKTVPLIAVSPDITIKAIQDNYASFISSDLLKTWEEHPGWAPGQLTSSPWPNRINILSLERNNDDGSYEIQGKIMEMTSVEATSGNEIDSGEFVAMKIRKQDNKWIITGFTKAVPR